MAMKKTTTKKAAETKASVKKAAAKKTSAQKTATETEKKSVDGNVGDAHEKVQLWKDGPYWATTNIGAEKPEDFGYYFWWGDTVGYKREKDKWVATDGSSSDFSLRTRSGVSRTIAGRGRTQQTKAIAKRGHSPENAENAKCHKVWHAPRPSPPGRVRPCRSGGNSLHDCATRRKTENAHCGRYRGYAIMRGDGEIMDSRIHRRV